MTVYSRPHWLQSTPSPEADDAMATAEAIADALGNKQQDGKDWRCTCPLCGHRSLSLQDRGAVLLVKCWNGCDTKAIRSHLKRRKLYCGKGNGPTRPETRPARGQGQIRQSQAQKQTRRRAMALEQQ